MYGRPPRREKKRRRSFGLRIRLTPSTTAVIWRERKKNEKARVKRATIGEKGKKEEQEEYGYKRPPPRYP